MTISRHPAVGALDALHLARVSIAMCMHKTIAIVEDQATLRDNYADAVRKQGFRVVAFADRHAAEAAFRQQLPDLVIIDVMLGDEVEGGFELCHWLRGQSQALPIIFLTARDSDLDTVSGLRLGADDYLSKDISLAHLTARVVALFRRTEALQAPAQASQCFERGALRLAPERMVATWNGEAVPLTVTEFWLLHSLVRHPGHVKTRAQLMDDARVVVDEPTITSHIKRMRRKFQQLDAHFDGIETVYGAGYRWREG